MQRPHAQGAATEGDFPAEKESLGPTLSDPPQGGDSSAGANTYGGGDASQLTRPLPSSRSRESSRRCTKKETQDDESRAHQHGGDGGTYQDKLVSMELTRTLPLRPGVSL